jgi:hypothetical protein
MFLRLSNKYIRDFIAHNPKDGVVEMGPEAGNVGTAASGRYPKLSAPTKSTY